MTVDDYHTTWPNRLTKYPTAWRRGTVLSLYVAPSWKLTIQTQYNTVDAQRTELNTVTTKPVHIVEYPTVSRVMRSRGSVGLLIINARTLTEVANNVLGQMSVSSDGDWH